MIDIEARAERVRTIVAASHGRVIERIGDKIAFEVPADVAPGLPWGPSGINTGGQWVRQLPRADYHPSNPLGFWLCQRQ